MTEAERPATTAAPDTSTERDDLIALATRGGDRQALARQILERLQTATPEAILKALDESLLDGLVDADGNDCRKRAVERLLDLGFPHALSVNPQDLAWARRPDAPSQAKVAPVTAAFTALLAVFAAMDAGDMGLWPVALLSLATAGLAGFAARSLALSATVGRKQPTRAEAASRRAWGLRALVASLPLSLISSIWTMHGLFALPLGTAALAALLAWSQDPGDAD